jgi:hypothetical protein
MATRCKLVYINYKNHTCINKDGKWKMHMNHIVMRTINSKGKREKTRYHRIEN